MRALVVTIPEKGHYLPLLGPALALEARGVDVTWASVADIASDLSALGVRRFEMPPGARPPSDALRGEALSRVIADPDELARWIRLLLVDLPHASVVPMREIVRAVRPDVVAIDTMAYAGAIAAMLEGIPWVGWATSLNPVIPDSFDSALIRTTRALEPARRALFTDRGLTAPRFRVSDALSDLGTATFTTEALVGTAPPGVALVGPSLRPPGPMPDWLRDARPRVYASFGSQAWYQPERYRRLVEAARPLDVELVLAMGDLARTLGRELERAGSVRAFEVTPQLRILERARAIVTHGGANSIMESLSHGVPLLVSPLCNDQPHNARFVERAGAGIALDLDRASTSEITDALRALLADGTLRQGARRIAGDYETCDGAVGAAELALRAVAA